MAQSDVDVKVVVDTARPCRLLQQFVFLSGIDFEQRTLDGFTELSLIPLDSSLREIHLNASNQVKIEKITINDVDSQFIHQNPFADDTLADKQLRQMSENLYKAGCLADSAQNGGELIVQVPDSLADVVQERKVLKVGIDFWLEKPSFGLQFVVPDSTVSSEASVDWSLREKAPHLFTYRNTVGPGCTRCWLPCVDAPNELCLWKIEICCDVAMTAVCSGELTETVYTADMRRKTFHYQLSVPTAALNIGFAVGPFEIAIHPEMSEVTNFCLPKLLPLLKHSTSTLDRVFEFFEELLSCRFPYASYKQVFVDQVADEKTDYAGLVMFSTNVLYHKRILDIVPHSRTLMAHAIAGQFFGCFVSYQSWLDSWVIRGLARYITALYIQRSFGNNEYLYLINRLLNSICDYEALWGPVFLRALKSEQRVKDCLHFDPRCSETCSPAYVDVLSKKGHFVLRMLEKKLGKEPLFQVLHRILAVASQASQQKFQPVQWQSMLLSTESFFNTISNVRGWESPDFLEQWIYGGGHAHFQANYSFNRKRNAIELELKQEPSIGRGRQKYIGPLSITVQELDGSFSHTVQIDDVISRHDLSCHSKGRRQKKKRVPLCTGEEVELDLTLMDPDSPILWLRIDPELQLVRKVDLRQPDYQWQYQLKYEKDVLAQFHALEILPRFPSPQSRFTLSEVLEHEQLFYRVRCQAAFTMSDIANKLQNTWTGPPAMLNLFQKLYGSQSCIHIPRPNNFGTIGQQLQQYFIMQAMPQAMAMLRTAHGHCVPDVHKFLLDLLKFNDNTKNRYADYYYKAALLNALSTTVCSLGQYSREARVPTTPDDLPTDVRETLDELTLALNLEKLRPSYNRVVMISSIRGLYNLVKKGHLPSKPDFLWAYARPGQFYKVRTTALDCLVDFVATFKHSNVLMELLEICQNDHDPGVRYHLGRHLSYRPPFSARTAEVAFLNPLNTSALVDKLIQMIMSCTEDPRLRCTLVDLYCAMYGRGIPSCLRGAAPSGSAQPPSMLMASPLETHNRPASAEHRVVIAGAVVESSFDVDDSLNESIDEISGTPIGLLNLSSADDDDF